MNLLFVIQLIILFWFNFNLKFVNSIFVEDDLHFPELIRTATNAPPPPLVLPNPTSLIQQTDSYNPYRTNGRISIVDDGDVDGDESHPITLHLKPAQHEPYKKFESDKTFIEKTLDKYEARHKDKSGGDHQNVEHKSSKNGGKAFHTSAKGAKGESTKDKHHKQYADKGGKEHHDSDEDSHADQHHNYHGGAAKSKFNKKHRDNKRRTEKGFHSKYHKNEHHKLDDFFKNYNENGEFLKYGNKNTKKHNVYKNLKKGAHKSQKSSESKVQKKGPKLIKLTII